MTLRIGNILLLLYSVAVIIMLAIITIMFDFHLIQIPLYFVAVFNFYCIYISYNHKE